MLITSLVRYILTVSEGNPKICNKVTTMCHISNGNKVTTLCHISNGGVYNPKYFIQFNYMKLYATVQTNHYMIIYPVPTKLYIIITSLTVV